MAIADTNRFGNAHAIHDTVKRRTGPSRQKVSSGWWLIPVALLSVAIWVGLITLLVRALV